MRVEAVLDYETPLAHLLIVEDSPSILESLQEVLSLEGYRVTCASDGQEALAAFDRETPDMIISDLMMPRMNGFELLEAVRQRPQGAVVPFLFLSARDGSEVTSHARSLGADDYLVKPFDNDHLLVAIRAKLERRRASQLFDTHNAHLQTVILLANTIEARESYTRGHVERVRLYALSLANYLNWSKEAQAIVQIGALLHDIGKIAVSRRILNKRSRLTYREWIALRAHPVTGAGMLNGVDHLHGAIPYVLAHHERWDGQGYPRQLAGAAIPIEGRLLAVVDTFDAMTTNRPYRRALPHEVALNEIRAKAGSQFDPDMAHAFVTLCETRGVPCLDPHNAS